MRWIAIILLGMGMCLAEQALLAQETTSAPDNSLVVREIILNGNKVTKRNIILRELAFTGGDTIMKMELIPALERSRENLLNLSLFNFVTLDVEHLSGNQINVLIDVQERWYIWPSPIFEHGDRNLSSFLKEPKWNKVNYGLALKWNNFRGRNEVLNAMIRLGYKENYVLQYEKPNLGTRQNHKLTASYSLSRQHRINYITRSNKPVYFTDENEYALNSSDAFIAYSYRPQLYSRHRIRLHLINDRVSDSVALLNPEFFGVGYTSYRHLSLDYVFTYDARDSKIYPLEGEALKLKVQRSGLGIFKEYPFGGIEAEAAVFYHTKIGGRFYFTDVAKGKISSNKTVPLVQQKAFGYTENLTGYDDYIIDGTDYFVNKIIFKFQAVRPKTISVPFLNIKQFSKIHFAMYINVLGDFGYVKNITGVDPSNFMVNALQYSTGIGIDFVTYYDKVLGIEYAINKYGATGFFFHVKTPFYDW